MKPGEHKTVQARSLEYAEEIGWHNGHREDVVFLVNGIPLLVIECKNANKPVWAVFSGIGSVL